MSVFNFKPSRSQQKSIDILSDFDALLTQSVGFKFQDKIYEIEIVTVENFMKITQAYQKVIRLTQERMNGSPVSKEEVLDAYFAVVQPLVPKFTLELLESLTMAQLNALMNLILTRITGEPPQKKNFIPTPDPLKKNLG